jgi:hypothetical protein
MSANPDTEGKMDKPHVLFVDDEPDSLRPAVALGLGNRAHHEVLHPREVVLEHLEQADLVLVDVVLDDWEERDAQPCIALQPPTGIALGVLLREHVDRSPKDRLTAFALHSAHLRNLQGRLPATTVQHVLARLNNLEWAFPKTEERRYEQMVLLAEAVKRLPRDWPESDHDIESQAMSLLGLDEELPWLDRCWREVQECRAPLHELRDRAHGVLFIRWLLHQVMPYPCFLSEVHWVGSRLRVPVAGLKKVLTGKSVLAKDLQERKYTGVLAGFLGDRWWRGALEDYVWELTGGRASDAQRLHDALQERAGTELPRIESNPPVVCLDAELQPTGAFATPATAVRVRPDHWPTFADAAWLDIETVRSDAALVAMVDPLDQERIPGETEE